MIYITTILLLAALIITLLKYNSLLKDYKILKDRFKELQDLSGTGYFDGSFADEKVWWSEELHRKVGRPIEDRIDTKDKAIGLIYEEDRGDYLQAIQKAIQTKQILEEEYRAFSQEFNELRHFFTKAKITFDNSGNPVMMQGVVRDITAEKEIENKLIYSEKRYQELTDLLPIGVFEIDNNFNLIYSNKKLLEIYGIEQDKELIGESILDYLPSHKSKDISNKLESLNPDDYLFNSEYKVNTATNNQIDILLYASPIYNKNTKIGYRGTIADISERKREQLELQKISKLESLSSLAGGIAHNFKNILSAITLSVDMIKMQNNTNDRELDRISSSLNKANAIATKFQTYTKSYLPNYSLCDINGIVSDAAELVKAGSTNRFELDLDKSIVEIDLDEMQIHEVIMNLLLNADQSMESTGTIKVCTEIAKINNEAYVKLIVEDNGTGIEKNHIDKIFNPFFTTKKNGHGLGLLTVHSIIKQHNGDINVKSEINKGTKFEILLPYKKTSISKIKSSESMNLSKKKYNIAMLDDEEIITSTIKEMFDLKEEMNLTIYNNPEVFLEEYSKNNVFDLVILDINLVGYNLNGYQVLKKIKKLDSEVKSILFSALMTEEVKKQINDDCTYALNKPANYDTIRNKIIEVLA